MIKKEHPLIKAVETFLKRVREAESDPCIMLNVGYHDSRILSAWTKLKKEANKIPLLKEQKRGKNE